MPQSLSNILVHLIFSTKDRQPWLGKDVREKAHAFLAGAVRQCECEAYRVGGVADHVHLAVRLSRTLSIANLVKETKTASSKWLKTQNAKLTGFFVAARIRGFLCRDESKRHPVTIHRQPRGAPPDPHFPGRIPRLSEQIQNRLR